MTIKKIFADVLRWCFARRRFYRINQLLFLQSLRGLGILNYEQDQKSEDRLLRTILRYEPCCTVLDVGAHHGRYSNKIKVISINTTIYAFEPNPNAYQYLQKEASKYDYTALNLGFGEEEGWLELYDYSGTTSGSEHASMYRDVIEKMYNSSSQSWKVKVTTVDHFIKNIGLDRIHLLKIDTEGHEMKVLLGAKKSIELGLIDIIQFEFNMMNIMSRTFFLDFFNILPHYNFYRLLPDGLLPLGSYNPVMCEIFGFQNIIAIRQDCDLAKHLPLAKR